MPRVGEAYSEDELATLRPFAILFTEPEEGFVATSIASSEAFDFAGSGRMIAVLEQDIPREIDRDKGEIDRRVKNAIGLIIDELCDRSGKAGFLAFHRVSFTGPARVDRDEKQSLGGGDAIGCELRFEWGVETGT